MKRHLCIRVLAAVVSIVTSVVRAETVAETTKLFPIFNGQDFTGWTAKDMKQFWRVEKGVLIGESDSKLSESYLWTEKTYGDFVLQFEVKWTGETDSGIEFRKPGIQLQLGVSRSVRKDMSGSFFVGKAGYPLSGQATAAATLMRPEGQWNSFRLVARGATFTVWINGRRAAEYTNDGFPGAAPVGLQITGGLKMKVEYRNISAASL